MMVTCWFQSVRPFRSFSFLVLLWYNCCLLECCCCIVAIAIPIRILLCACFVSVSTSGACLCDGVLEEGFEHHIASCSLIDV